MRIPLTVVWLLRRTDVTRICALRHTPIVCQAAQDHDVTRICGAELSRTVASHFKNNRDSRLNANGDGVARHWPPRGRRMTLPQEKRRDEARVALKIMEN